MKYKLIGKNNRDNIIETILFNRGIENPQGYLNLNDSYCNNYENLDNINEAVECFAAHFERGDEVCILIDTDP